MSTCFIIPACLKRSLQKDSNFHASLHSHLKRACLPFHHTGFCLLCRDDWTRTSDLMLPKHAYYQLYYIPILCVIQKGLEPLTRNLAYHYSFHYQISTAFLKYFRSPPPPHYPIYFKRTSKFVCSLDFVLTIFISELRQFP